MADITLLSITPNAEKLIEEAGRTCYLSFEKTTSDSHKSFIRMLLKRGHHSVLEHAGATFRIIGGSRAFTHQFVRHRLCSFSQQSQRYVHEEDFKYVTPDSIRENPSALKIFEELIEHSRKAYESLKGMNIRKEDARFVLPNAIESEIVFTANFRELRHIFEQRCDKSAQWEIRDIAMQMLRVMKEQAPTVFEDFIIDEATNTVNISH